MFSDASKDSSMAKQLSAEILFRAVEETLHTVFREQRYEVPYYQRPYAWEEENAEDLFDDLLTAFQSARAGNDSHFLGSVLFNEGETDRHKIIDGQQRLVTLQLLLLALANEIKDSNSGEELLSYVRSKENVFADGVHPV
jgi:uncharacterized protein with ParB-like and HNH nuclease domain